MSGTKRVQDATSLGRAAWIEAALDVLAAEGIDRVRVELLARKLSITKGSFYHHFKDRSDLHEAMLQEWRRTMVTQIIGQLQQISDPRERFHQLMRLPAAGSRASLDMELAIRLWARRDAKVQAALEEVDQRRIDFIAGVIEACGILAPAARARAILAFAYLRAAVTLADEPVRDLCEQLLIRP